MRSRLPLAIFDPNASTFVTVDASDVGLGAELSQIQEGRRVSIQFALHTLSPAERNYAVNEKEALACPWACEHWEKFLPGQPFFLFALITIAYFHSFDILPLHASQSSLTGGLIACRGSITRSNTLRAHRMWWPTHCHVCPVQTSTTTTSVDNASTSVKRIASTAIVPISDTTIRRLTAADPVLAQVITCQRGKWPPKTKLASSLRPYFDTRNELSQHDNILTRTDDCIVVPSSLQQRILHVAHQGHPGIVRMKRQLQLTYWGGQAWTVTLNDMYSCTPQHSNKTVVSNSNRHCGSTTSTVCHYSHRLFQQIPWNTNIQRRHIRYDNIMAMWYICTFWQSRHCDNGQWPAIHLIRTLNTSAPQCIIRSKVVESFNKYLKHSIQTFSGSAQNFREWH